MTTEYFTLKEDGKLYWIQEPAKVPAFASSAGKIGRYKQALQSAIDSAVEVSNQEEVLKKIYGQDGLVDGLPENFYAWKDRSIGKPYSLLCSVEKKEYCPDYVDEGRPFDCPFVGSGRHKTVALVTFPSSAGVEETQEPVFEDPDLGEIIQKVHEDMEGRYDLTGEDLHTIQYFLCQLQPRKNK